MQLPAILPSARRWPHARGLPQARSGWIMRQTWHDLLFAHWPLQPDTIRPLVPQPLQLDLFDEQAWLGVVAFRLSGVRMRWLPEIGCVSNFPEINVRTYVRYGDRQGVLFLSLDADNPLVIALARPWFRLNYIKAHIAMLRHEGGIRFVSYREGQRDQRPFFSANYHPTGQPYHPEQGSLDHWLTERYSFFAVDRRARPLRCDVQHRPWQLQGAEAEIGANTLAQSHGITLPETEPLLYYAERMEARIWPIKSRLAAGTAL